jgi:hypothetical protein
MWRRRAIGAKVPCDGKPLLDELGVIQQQVSFETIILQGHPLVIGLKELIKLIHP